MGFKSFDGNCTYGARRAEEFAFAAANALFFGNHGAPYAIDVYHRYGSCGAMALAGTAGFLAGSCKAEVRIDDRGTDAYKGLLVFVDGTDGSCGTDLRAGGTLRAAESVFLPHLRLQQMVRVG